MSKRKKSNETTDQTSDMSHLLSLIDSVIGTQDHKISVTPQPIEFDAQQQPQPQRPRTRTRSYSSTHASIASYNTLQLKAQIVVDSIHLKPDAIMVATQSEQQLIPNSADAVSHLYPPERSSSPYWPPDSPVSISDSSKTSINVLDRASSAENTSANSASTKKGKHFRYPSTVSVDSLNHDDGDGDNEDDEKYAALPFPQQLSTIASDGFSDDSKGGGGQEQREREPILLLPNQSTAADPRSALHSECKKTMILYNSKSGGQKASSLVQYLRAYTDVIFDLLQLATCHEELERLAHALCTYEHTLVVCIVGGDGSQSWACSLLDAALDHCERVLHQNVTFPTVVPFPVGTGNDLSRSLGWGSLERTPEKIIKYMADAEYCFNLSKRLSVLDRWGIDYAFPHLAMATEPPRVDAYRKRFSPPLPRHFLCYLSFGYDAMITYKFAEERRTNPQRFRSQRSNQSVYLRMGIKEFLRPSNPVNDSIELEIDGKAVAIPRNTRSLKLVNINSAASGIFFWGNQKSRADELQTWKRPQLDDGLIEVMATRGGGDLAMAKTHLSHAHRLGQSNDIRLRVVRPPTYLQIDGEGWYIDKACVLHVKLHDQLPTLVGYKYPRGVYHGYEINSENYTDAIKKARHRFRQTVAMKYNIPRKLPSSRASLPGKLQPDLGKKQSQDDFHLPGGLYNAIDENEEECTEMTPMDEQADSRQSAPAMTLRTGRIASKSSLNINPGNSKHDNSNGNNADTQHTKPRKRKKWRFAFASSNLHASNRKTHKRVLTWF